MLPVEALVREPMKQERSFGIAQREMVRDTVALVEARRHEAGYLEGFEAGAKAAREAVARKLASIRVSPAAASLYAEMIRAMGVEA